MVWAWQNWLSPRPQHRTKNNAQPSFLRLGDAALYEPLSKPGGHWYVRETHYIENALVRAGLSGPPLGDKVEELETCAWDVFKTNVVGNIHFFNLFVTLVKKGKVKKVIAITTGLADLDLTNECELDVGSLYSASKAALNIIVAKFSAQYKKEGLLFLSISPGLVEVGRYDNTSPEDMQGMMGSIGNLARHAPHFKGAITPEESVRHVRSTWEKASIDNGFAGAFISHLGNKQWV